MNPCNIQRGWSRWRWNDYDILLGGYMGLKTKKMKYIQIKNNGEFVIYPTEKYRLKHKNATPKEVILAEYDKYLKEQDDKISSYLADKGIDPYKLTKEEIEY